MRNIFGWDLPPGCTHRMIEEQCAEGPCAVCGYSVDDCVCPECEVCSQHGDPSCYSNGHIAEFTAEQQIGKCRARIAELKEKILDEEQCLAQLESDLAERSSHEPNESGFSVHPVGQGRRRGA